MVLQAKETRWEGQYGRVHGSWTGRESGTWEAWEGCGARVSAKTTRLVTFQPPGHGLSKAHRVSLSLYLRYKAYQTQRSTTKSRRHTCRPGQCTRKAR